MSSEGKIRLASFLALAAAAGLAGETLLLVERHCSRLESSLSEDFRVVLFAPASLEEARAHVLEEKLRAAPDVLDVRFVPADEALAALKRDDPELAEATALVGDNPLPSAFEVRPAPRALTRLGSFLDGVRRLSDWSDLRWKPGQVQAILRLRFYSYLLRVALSSLLCLIAALALGSLSLAANGAASRGKRLALWAAAAGAGGAAFALAMSWPLHRDELLWAWPEPIAQLALVGACATLGWSLSLWRAEA